MQKSRRTGILVEKPQSRKTESVEPMVDTRMQVVMCHRSTIPPIATQPNTAATLIRMSVSAATLFDAPIDLAYVGRYSEGRKYPRPSRMLPSCSNRNVLLRRNARSRVRWRVDCATGRRGLRKMVRGAVQRKSTMDQMRRVVRKPWVVRRCWRRRGMRTPPKPVPAWMVSDGQSSC